MEQKHIHFIGIGGIGMSALAHIYHARGYKVSGCDTSTNTQVIADLQARGCIIASHHEHAICLDPSIQSYIYSTDIRSTHPEIIYAKNQQKELLHRSELLAELCANHTTIAISGSHGKTTTTTLLNHIFSYADYDPTSVIGGYCNIMNSNYRIGKSNYVITEADESDRSFLRLPKTIGIITNIDYEHADTYKDILDLQETYTTFGNTIPDSGHMIICADSPYAYDIMPHIKNPISYGTSNEADYKITDLQMSPEGTTFTLRTNKENLGTYQLPLIGKHVAYNAAAAIIAAKLQNIPLDNIKKACATFQGALRRFTYKGTYLPEQITIIDDYAHHPTEIKATLETASIVAKNNIILIFQPHRYTRFHALWDDFKEIILDERVKHVIVTDLYSAREEAIANVSSQKFVQEINRPHITYCSLDENFAELSKNLKKIVQKNDLVLTIGAGNITHFAKNFK